MFQPLALFIGLRYTRAKRRNHFISFISLSSMIGIALGIIVLITVLSVMNGFDYHIRTRIFSMARQVTVSQMGKGITNWHQLDKQIMKDKKVVAIAPYIDGQGMLTTGGTVRAVMVTGINPKQTAKVSNLAKKVVQGSLGALQAGKFGVVIGDQLAQFLGLEIGDKVTLVTPHASVTPVGVIPSLRAFTVVGIFHAGKGFGFDQGWAFINLHDAQALYGLGDHVTGLRLRLHNLYSAPNVVNQLSQKFNNKYWISDWTQQYGSLFSAIALEKTMMFLILLLIIGIAAFNLVSSLVMVVTDKQADIAILRTLGASPQKIMAIFMVQGSLIGAIGTIIGIVGGILLSENVTAIVNIIQNYFHVQFLSSNIYYVNYLPSKLEWTDVWHVCVIALLMSLLATLYPAWRASRVQPAEALRYE